MIQNYQTEFLTGTIFNWEHLLINDDFKISMCGSFEWLDRNKKCTINAFVIMPNHIHLFWKIADGFERKDVEGALFSFTAREFKRHLNKTDSVLLENHFADKSDGSYQFWERKPIVKECWTKDFLRQN